MSGVGFSLCDYQEGLVKEHYRPPVALCPFYDVDPVRYQKHADTDRRRGKLRQAIEELRARTDREYFQKTYPLQGRTLDFSSRSFPAYRFILPEVMTEDWLAIVDWGKFQRDHVLHQPLCGYVVLKLLDGGGGSPVSLPTGKTILDQCVRLLLDGEIFGYLSRFLKSCGMRESDPILDPHSPIAWSVWRVFFREAAFVAAVFHDIGYPWQYAQRLEGNLEGMNAFALEKSRSAEQIYDLHCHRLLFHAMSGYQQPDAACPSNWRERIITMTEEALAKTHGLPGALGFLHLNDSVRRYPASEQNPLRLLCVEWAATAIMMHDLGKEIYWGTGLKNGGTPENPFMRLSFRRDPLSALVALTDVIQDFQRPFARFEEQSHAKKPRVTIEYKTSCTKTEMTIAASRLQLQYEMTTSEMCSLKRKSIGSETRLYFDPQHGYLDMSDLGIDSVEMSAYPKS